MKNTDIENCILTLVIPSYNEAESLKSYITELLLFADQQNWKIILVNDGSKDNTTQILEPHLSNTRLTVIKHKVNRGYGGAIKSGIRSVITKYCVTIDADGQHQLEDVISLLATMVENDADLIVGNRKGSNASGWFRELGKSIIRSVAKIMMPLTIYDINSGMKMYNTKLAKNYINLCPDTMAFSDIVTLIFIFRRNLVIEKPITINKRTAGTSTINIRTAFDTVIEIVNIVVLFNPLRIFLPLSITLITISFIWATPLVIMGHGLAVGALLGFTTGLIFFALGLIAEQLGNIRRLAANNDD